MRAVGTLRRLRGVRDERPGLFFFVALLAAVGFGPVAGCTPIDRRALAAADDRAAGTTAYTWLLDHEPSALVVWRIPLDRIRALLPRAHLYVARGRNPCAQTVRARAALLVRASARVAGERPIRDIALDCGFAIFKDDSALVIAPR